MRKDIKILDYGVGNLSSIYQAFEKFDVKVSYAKNSKDIMEADQLILPGVGAFSSAMSKLENLDLVEPIKKFAISGKNILGICLGMQILFEKSYEFGEHQGLALIEGNVEKIKHQNGYKIPNISWSTLNINCKDHKIFKNTNDDAFYFVHSFTAKPKNIEENLATSTFGDHNLCAIAGYENVIGTQFHPEKSGKKGLNLIKNWLD